MSPTVKKPHSITPEEKVRLAASVRAVQGGDQGSIGPLIESSQSRLLRFCIFLCGNPPLGQDLCQDTLLRVLERIKDLREPDAFVGWMFRVASNLHLDFLKGSANKNHDSLDDLEDTPAAAVQDRSEAMQVSQTLQLLAPEDRMVLLLVDLEGHSYAEAAENIGDSEAAVRSRLHRARRAFLEKFSRS